LKKKLGVEAKLVQSSGGVFEVEVNGELVFSKKKLGRFPEGGEIVRLIEGIKKKE